MFVVRLTTMVLAVLMFAACGRSIRGTYSSVKGSMLGESKLVFNTGGKVEITMLDQSLEGTYVIEDDEVRVSNAGTLIYKIDEDGCLDSGKFGKFCKAKK